MVRVILRSMGSVNCGLLELELGAEPHSVDTSLGGITMKH